MKNTCLNEIINAYEGNEAVAVVFASYEDYNAHKDINFVGVADHVVYEFLDNEEDAISFFNRPEVQSTYPKEVIALLTDDEYWGDSKTERNLYNLLKNPPDAWDSNGFLHFEQYHDGKWVLVEDFEM